MTSVVKVSSRYRTSTGIDWAPLLLDFEQEEKTQIQLKYRPNHAEVIHHKWGVSKTTLYRYYKLWKEVGKPNRFVVPDKRKNKNTKLTTEVEQKLVTEIKQAYENQSALSRKKFQDRAIELCNNLEVKKPFKASIGWIKGFEKRNKVSVQRTSRRPSGQEHRSIQSAPKEVKEYTEKVEQAIKKYSPERVFNADETGRNGLSGATKAYADRRSRSERLPAAELLLKELNISQLFPIIPSQMEELVSF